jgi:AraC-like DNA-binding protein
LIKLTALLLVLFVTAFGAIFLVALSTKKLKNRLLLSFFFFISFLVFFGNFLAFFNFYKIVHYYDFIFLAALLAFYPSYYLYLFSAFNFKISKAKWIYHFIPSIVIGLLMLMVSFSSNQQDFQTYINNNVYGTPLTTETSKALDFIYDFGRIIHLIQIILYTFLAIRIILIGKKSMTNSFSNLENYQLRFFYITGISFITLMSIPGFYITLMDRTKFSTNDFSLLYLSILFTILYVILAIIGLKQKPSKEYLNNFKKPKIHHKEMPNIEDTLLKYFKKEKPWLHPDLSIWEVANHIGTNRTYISHIINGNLANNFNSFVNNYRIKEAKKLLLKKGNIPISEISELSGFGSVNSFIRIFKQVENQTPSNFRKKNT